MQRRRGRVTGTVLIVGQSDDPHVQRVVERLRQRGVQPVVLDVIGGSAPTSRLTYELAIDRGRGSVEIQGAVHALEDIRAVWWRMKLLAGPDLSGLPTAVAGEFALREWRSALDSLDAFTPGARWINRRAADVAARHKPVQLMAAREVGLSVPETLVSNSPEAVSAFVGDDAGYVYKTLTWFHGPPDRMVFTSPVSAADVQEDPQAIALAPGIFQRRVPKRHELRVTVVGDRALAVRIDSQARADTRLDWRRNQFDVPYFKHELTPQLEEALVALTRKLGLAFGAHDLIVTPDGETVFLEVNPIGQWLWLERATGIDVSNAVADELSGDAEPPRVDWRIAETAGAR
jgi:glutathione synthase/RimK-type ligase-like ATP-grasp enzyme